MSKIKEELLKQEEVKMEYMYKFMDHLYDLMPKQIELSEDDINTMESEVNQNLIPLSKEIISNASSNNVNYNPKLGA